MEGLSPWDALFERWLDATERARAARFAFSADRLRYQRSHGLLRGLLAAAVGADPAALAFELGPAGKPQLPPHLGVKFNLSHSGDRALVAWSREAEIGADVERIQPGIASEGIAQRFFAADELRLICDAPEPDAVFTRIWTRKEAVIKAWGDGLGVDLQSFSVSSQAAASTLVGPPASSVAGRAWWCCDLEVQGPYRAALAGEGVLLKLQQQLWPSSP